MIALADARPIVIFQSGESRQFDQPWLDQSVAHSSRIAGYKKWWLTPHVTQSLIEYLEEDYVEPAITVEELAKAVQTVLQAIGFDDIASAFEFLPPTERISLEDVARDAGTGYELAFFDLLRERVREALARKTDRLEITDAHRGIKLLRSAKNWRKDCRGLLDEVVGFVRSELVSHSHSKVDMQLT